MTQHLPAPFMTVFARQLGTAAGREAIVAEDGLRLLPDRVVIAPGDANLTVDIHAGRLIIKLDRQRAPSGCLPSVDPMLSSAGALLGRDALGVVFSGMGRDGLEGAMRLAASAARSSSRTKPAVPCGACHARLPRPGLPAVSILLPKLHAASRHRIREAACR